MPWRGRRNIHVSCICHVICNSCIRIISSHQTDTRGDEGPAPLHPGERPVANHPSHVVHEAVSTCNKVESSIVCVNRVLNTICLCASPESIAVSRWRGLCVPMDLRGVLSGAWWSWYGYPWQSCLRRGARLRMVPKDIEEGHGPEEAREPMWSQAQMAGSTASVLWLGMPHNRVGMAQRCRLNTTLGCGGGGGT